MSAKRYQFKLIEAADAPELEKLLREAGTRMWSAVGYGVLLLDLGKRNGGGKLDARALLAGIECRHGEIGFARQRIVGRGKPMRDAGEIGGRLIL